MTSPWLCMGRPRGVSSIRSPRESSTSSSNRGRRSSSWARLSIPSLTLPKVGDLAGPFEFETPAGTKTNVAALRGNYVLIDFWATWCGPCVAKLDEVERLRNHFAGDRPAGHHRCQSRCRYRAGPRVPEIQAAALAARAARRLGQYRRAASLRGLERPRLRADRSQRADPRQRIPARHHRGETQNARGQRVDACPTLTVQMTLRDSWFERRV